VISELAELGAQLFVRVGTCGALDPSLALGDLVVATEAIAADGTSRALGADGRVGADASLAGALLAAGGRELAAGPVVSADLFYDGPDPAPWRDAGALAIEMETATLYALAVNRGHKAASLLIVSDLVGPEPVRIDPDALRAAEHRLGEIAARALR
jgi:uridine phosphorylase